MLVFKGETHCRENIVKNLNANIAVKELHPLAVRK